MSENAAKEKIASMERRVELPSEIRKAEPLLTKRGRRVVDDALSKLKTEQGLDIPMDERKHDYVGLGPHRANAILYIYDSDNRRKYSLKMFSPRSEGIDYRFQREVGIINYLNKEGTFPFQAERCRFQTPDIVVTSREEGYMVYEYIQDNIKLPKEELAKVIKDYVLLLDAINTQEEDFSLKAKDFASSPKDILKNHREAFAKAMEYIEKPTHGYEKNENEIELPPNALNYLEEHNILGRIIEKEKYILQAIKKFPEIYKKETPDSEWRINQGDLSVSNMLVQSDSNEEVTFFVMDYEDGGLDSRFGIFSFLYHPQIVNTFTYSERMSLLEEIVQAMNLTEDEIIELNMRMCLFQLHWISKKLKGADPEKNKGWRYKGGGSWPDQMPFSDFLVRSYYWPIEKRLRESPLQYNLGSPESFIVKPLYEMPPILEEEIEKYALEFLEQGRKEWDESHTRAVVFYAEEIAKKEGLDLMVLKTTAWLHDIGYHSLFEEMESKNYEEVRNKKKDHMVRGAEMAEKFLNRPEISRFYTNEQKKRIIHLVSIHDKTKELKDKDEIAFMEADTLGAIDISRVVPTYEGNDLYRYVTRVLTGRFRKFQTHTGIEYQRKLFPKFLDFVEPEES